MDGLRTASFAGLALAEIHRPRIGQEMPERVGDDLATVFACARAHACGDVGEVSGNPHFFFPRFFDLLAFFVPIGPPIARAGSTASTVSVGTEREKYACPSSWTGAIT